MHDQTVLEDLLARVQAALEPDRRLDAEIWAEIEEREVLWADMIGRRVLLGRRREPPHDVCVILSPVSCQVPVPAFTRSIDAAVALVRRVLPARGMILTHAAGSTACRCQIGTGDVVSGRTMPFAVVAALLTAMIEDGVKAETAQS